MADRSDRKAFFRETFGLLKRSVGKQVERKILKALEGPVRPPGALEEVEFLSTCTRCNACRDACPHQAIFLFPKQGLDHHTPFIDPHRRGCQFCADFPCVQVCEPKALVPERTPLPLGQATFNTSTCLAWGDWACSDCWDACPFPDTALLLDDQDRPVIGDACTGCGQCVSVCPVRPAAVQVRSRAQLLLDALEDQPF
jgi:ferredoxin-type protein NapG/ferredoxin-type protein NapH